MESSSSESEQYRLQGVEVTRRSLGSGSSTDVMEVRYIGLTCAAKKFNFTKHPGYKSREEMYSSRYHKHCCLLGKLRHPNLVQFIGYFCESDDLTPILVYEYVHMTLANCLENYGPLPDSINYSVLRDVAVALRYLHELASPIAHRSLSASKVLLTRDMSAKLSDVGVAGITELCQLSPGSEKCFVPPSNDRNETCFVPEIVDRASPEMELKNDIHSYGLLMIHIITGRCLLSAIETLDFTQSISMCESDMVEVLLNDIHDGHILLDLLEKCLSMEPHLRPSAITVLHKMTQVSSNYPPLFTNSLEMLQRIKVDAERQLAMRKLSQQNSIDLSQNNELDRLKELVSKISTQNVALQARIRSRSSSACYENGSSSPSQGRELMRQENQCITSPLQIRQGHIKWTECSDMPVSMFQGQAVYLKGNFYVGGGNTGSSITDALVFEYNLQKDIWTPLPPTYVSNFGLCKLEGELVMVGGVISAKVTSSVALFDSFTKRWKDSLPPLAVERQSPSCLSLRSAIIVCGGISSTGELLSSVEVMKSDTFQWYTAGYLPRSAMLCHSSPVAVHGSIYLLGGYKNSTAQSSSNVSHFSSIDLLLSYSGMTPYTWTAVPETPHFQSTAACFGSCLLSLGGTSSAYSEPVHRSIYGLSCSANAWVYAGDLPYGFCHGMAVSLPNNELYVMGGWVQPGKFKRSAKIYKGRVIIK